MKKTVVFLMVISAAMVSCAQNNYQSVVPSLVLNAFQQQFSNAKDVEWEMDNGYYAVEFEIGVNDHDAWFDSTGKLVKHKEDIAQTDLPEWIKTTIKTNYPRHRIDDVKKTTENGTIMYKVELERRSEDRVLVFSADGNLIENRLD